MPRVRRRAARRARREGLLGARDAAAAGPRRQGARARQAQVARRLARQDGLAAGPARRSSSSAPISTSCRSRPAGPATAAPSSRCRRSSRRTRARAGATSACTACRSYDATSTGLHWQIHKDAAADWRDGAGRMEVAISIGSDPITAYAGSCPAPKHVDELMVAGFLRGKPVELVQCKTVDLQVPARAEIVLEGYCERGELGRRGAVRRPHRLLHAGRAVPGAAPDRMTMRRDAIYPSILVGPPPAEDAWLGKATERLFLPALRATLPELVDYDLPVAGAFHNCCIVSIRKAYPGHARKVMHAVWGTGLLSLTKMVDRRRRVGRRARLRRGRMAGRRQRGSGPRRRAGARAARPARPRAVAAVARRQARPRRHRDLAGRGLPARVARGRAHERRGAPPGRRALGLARDRTCAPRPATRAAPRQRRGWRRS